jgi:hypothetical protein
MGQADLQNRFDREPPREPLDSVGALWRDHVWRKIERGVADPCIPYTAKSSNIEEAIDRACDSRGRDGKLWFHQGRVWQKNRDKYARRLKKQSAEMLVLRGRYGPKKGFNKLFDICQGVGESTSGIGPITIYDVTARLAAYLELRANRIYLHGGVISGVRSLGIETRGRKYIKRAELPEPLCQVENLDLVEDFLCGYRSELERLSECS